MKLKHLSTAMILATLPATGVFAAALDRSGQSMSAFLQPGNYFEAGISVLDPTVEGQEAGTSSTTRKIGDMGDDYMFPSAALKLQLTDKISFGLLYDQPFGADAKYTGENVFVSNPNDGVLNQKSLNDLSTKSINQLIQAAGSSFGPALQAVTGVTGGDPANPTQKEVLGALQQVAQGGNATVAGGLQKLQQTQAALNAAKGYLGSSTGSNNTEVQVDTQNLSMVFGFQPNKNLNFYAGPVLQTVKGSVKLRGEAYSVYNGYDADIKETTGAGWLAGAAYQIPEIALKASLTYRSEIDHDVKIREDLSLLGFPGLTDVLAGLGIDPSKLAGLNADKKTKITTPQSVNLDFQTGIMANTVAFANVRWVNWKDFSIQPYKFGELSKVLGGAGLVPGKQNGFNLVEYADDQWSVNAGVGRKLSEQWAGNVSVGWDSGAGNPVTTLGPTEGYWNVGLGLQYSPTPATFIAGGVKYFWLGDAKAQTGAQAGSNDYVAKFEDNNAIAYGLKIGYKF
ncbi:outer membrane protein transport protein [Acinetobacter courvalinii]|uniref:outer membrane protein transport protein n=1 Tax=Acinetobacter courvalinii TaxID=280147 RepID=UPI0019022DDA|nr:outer membrane protein transport protein [Acinetobacter courvalinii]MBJ9957313.1 outer membrane protein transport protein [Acinetobacter courvalinii]MCU4369474.1 outer membrane protein transport protein [Acinetobacter courvalinii]MCU4447679.1 outer membrane protein transport protein [Acinetobacter courvalinii]